MHTRVRVPITDPQAIERALSDLRRASLVGAGPGLPPMRATVVNLVAYAGSHEVAEEMAAWVAALAEQHPSRVVILGREPGAGEALAIWVSAHCHPVTVGHLVCFEEVQIMAQEAAVERLPAIVLSLLLRDLPVLLWWPGDLPAGTPLFDPLLAGSDRLLADLSAATDPEATLRQLAALGHAEHCRCAISDLTWDRLTPWRELTAQFFDPPDCRPCLDHLGRVAFEVAISPHRPDWSQAYLLGGWLATRLRWTPSEPVWQSANGGGRFMLEHEGQPVVLELVPESDARPPHLGLRGLLLEAQQPAGVATFALRRSADNTHAQVTTRLPGREVRQRVVPFPVPTPADLLGQELAAWGHDPVFGDALRMAAFLSSARAHKG